MLNHQELSTKRYLKRLRRKRILAGEISRKFKCSGPLPGRMKKKVEDTGWFARLLNWIFRKESTV